ncbi:hypothetical protein [Streptomyces chryseus]
MQDPLQRLYVGSARHLSSWLLALVHDIRAHQQELPSAVSACLNELGSAREDGFVVGQADLVQEFGLAWSMVRSSPGLRSQVR